MTRVVCDPGICGMPATIEVVRVSDPEVVEVGKRRVSLKVTCDCDRVTKMACQLVELDEGELEEWEPIKPRGEPKVCEYARKFRFCAACPVPTAILKAMEVEAELALPKPAHIYFETTKQE